MLDHVIEGEWYMVECGWGITKAKSEGSIKLEDGRIKYDWITRDGFRFCSYDLENTEKC